MDRLLFNILSIVLKEEEKMSHPVIVYLVLSYQQNLLSCKSTEEQNKIER